MKNFAERLTVLMRSKGLSQSALASRLGIGQSTVNGWLNLGANPQPRMMRDLAAALSVPIEWLAEGTGPMIHKVRAGGDLDPRAVMREARVAKGLSFSDLAKLTRYRADTLQKVEEGDTRASEKMIEAIAKALHLDKGQLMAGADENVVREGIVGTFGAKPSVTAGPGVGTPKFVPLLSMATAGTMSEVTFTDGGYTNEGVLAFDVKDPRAFGLRITGDSMSPQYNEGDIVIAYPRLKPQNDDLVVCRLKDEAGGNVMFKIYSTRDSGRRVVLSSYNPAYKDKDYAPEDFVWLFPVVHVTKTLKYYL